MICYLTSYNDDVTEDDEYGDPWQLIYVLTEMTVLMWSVKVIPRHFSICAISVTLPVYSDRYDEWRYR